MIILIQFIFYILLIECCSCQIKHGTYTYKVWFQSVKVLKTTPWRLTGTSCITKCPKCLNPLTYGRIYWSITYVRFYRPITSGALYICITNSLLLFLSFFGVKCVRPKKGLKIRPFFNIYMPKSYFFILSFKIVSSIHYVALDAIMYLY